MMRAGGITRENRAIHEWVTVGDVSGIITVRHCSKCGLLWVEHNRRAKRDVYYMPDEHSEAYCYGCW